MEFPNGVTTSQVARAISSRRLELTILPTEKCNFRCTYCYEDFLIGRMKPEIVRGVKALISARAPNLAELQINWFGGEPLLALAVMREISSHAHDLARAHGFQFNGGLTTNGYLLTRPVLDELLELRQNFFQVTLDGWGETHDKTRRRADGNGTFEKIWANLLASRASSKNFEVVLRIHVTTLNQDSLLYLCDQIRVEFGDDSRFRVDFQDVRNLGGDGGKSVTNLGPLDFRGRVSALNSALGNAPAIAAPEVPTGESAGSRRAYEIEAGEPYICYAARPNHLLIRADGRIGKCTVALDDPLNNLGTISPDGELKLDQERARSWSNGFEDFDLDALSCPLTRIHRWSSARDNKKIDSVLRV